MERAKTKSKFAKIIFFLIFVSMQIFAQDINYEDIAANATTQEIQRLFNNNSSLKKQTFGENKETFLMLALRNNRSKDVISACILAGSNVKAKTKDKKTPIMIASQYNTYTEVLDTLIKSGTKVGSETKKRVQAKDSYQKTAFDYARLNKNPEIYDLLLKYASDPAEDEKAKLAAKNAKKNKSTENQKSSQTVKEEIPETSSQNESLPNNPQENLNEIPENSAEIQKNQIPEQENQNLQQNQKLTQEENLPRVSSNNTSPVYPAENNLKQSQNSQNQNSSLNSENLSDSANLNTSSSTNSENQQNQQLNSENSNQSTNLEEIAKLEAEKNAREQELKLNTQKAQIKQYTQTFLYDYAEEPDEEPEITQKSYKIENPNLADSNGVTLLMKAAKAGNDWDIKNLINSGADVQMRDKDGWTALMYAVRYQNSLEILNILIQNGAYVRVRNKYNATPLLLAADYTQNPQILELLLANRSVNEEEVFKSFIFAITGTAGEEHIKMAKVQLYLDKEIQINRIWKGKTPLMYAAEYGSSTSVIQQLLDNGAKPGIKDAEGKTAFDYAKTNSRLKHDNTYWALNSSAK